MLGILVIYYRVRLSDYDYPKVIARLSDFQTKTSRLSHFQTFRVRLQDKTVRGEEGRAVQGVEHDRCYTLTKSYVAH
jgi:hypothetical protein